MRTRLLALIALAGCGGKQPVSTPPPPLPADAAVAPVDAPAPDVAVTAADDEAPHGDDDGHDHVDEEYACEDVVRDIEDYPPALTDATPERAWNLEIRGHVIDEDCEHLWTYENKECVATKGPAACQLPGDLVARLTKLGELGDKIAAAKKRPATIGCKQAVGAHYADIRWRNRLDGYSAAERRQMIASSRSLMLKACKEDDWPDRARACLMLGGGDLCFFASPIRRMWGYPADGSVKKVGVAECDDYDAAVTRLATCAAIEQHVRDSLVRTNDALKAQIAGLPAPERTKRAQSCRAALKPISDMVATFGC